MMKSRIKSIVLVMILTIIATCVFGTSLAWLQDSTTPVENTFTASTVKITLTEDGVTDTVRTKEFDMVPGFELSKDPKVTVKANSEKCYVFIEITETDVKDENGFRFEDYILYNVDTTVWSADSALPSNVYYKVVDKNEAQDQEFAILTGGTHTFENGENDITFSWEQNEVFVKPEVTEAMMEAIGENNQPKLSFKAYAIQYMQNNEGGFSIADAWNLAKTN